MKHEGQRQWANRSGHVREAFPPPTLERLRAIKRKWDPDRLFTQNFDVTELSGLPLPAIA
jgi:hypothetical protein